MPSDKDRLYIALYARGGAPKMPGGEDKYHWALLVGPKTEDQNARGQRFHAKEGVELQYDDEGERMISNWSYEAIDIFMVPSRMILVRVLIGKIKDRDRLVSILGQVPIRSTDPAWNCVEWVKEALEMLEKDGKALGTSVLRWNEVRNSCLLYVERKKEAHRFDGRAEHGQFDSQKVATWNLLEGTEIVA